MAGIGFELRKLARRDDLLGIVQGYAHSALTATGPWLMTIVALSSIVMFGSSIVSVEELNTFRLIVIYNFAFSLVMSGPVVMVTTRFLADSIYARDVGQAPSMLMGGLIVIFATQLIFVVPFYFFYVELDTSVRLIAVANFFLIAGTWLISAFLTALKDYNIITGTFGIGMIFGVTASAVLTPAYGVAGLLLGFTLGLATIFFGLISKVLAEYPYRVVNAFDFKGYFRNHWQLMASGFVYNCAIWVDKWVMWASPESMTLKAKMISYPDYDSAMFLAYLTIVPSIAAFVLSLETDFFEHYVRFYRDIQNHATLEEIQRNHRRVMGSIRDGARNFIVLQASICLTTILIAPQIFVILNVNFVQLGMFRIGVLGAFFHILLLGTTIIISYFDLRSAALKIQVLFLLANGILTYATMQLGFPYYGYGYFLATVATFVASFVVLARFIGELPYQAFVVNNPSVK